MMSRPVIEFETDDRLGLGEFGIETRVVRPEEAESELAGHQPHPGGRDEAFDLPAAPPPGAQSGRTMVFSTAERVSEPLAERARSRQQSALLITGGRRLVVGPEGVTLGRSRSADITLDDPNVSRTHAEIRPRGGSWVLTDLGSTNGSRVNGRSLTGPEVLKPGDEIELGASVLRFELE